MKRLDHLYARAVRDEQWIVSGNVIRDHEVRIESGQARTLGGGAEPESIIASDEIAEPIRNDLMARLDTDAEALIELLGASGTPRKLRVVSASRFVENDTFAGTEATTTVSIGAEHFGESIALVSLLREAPSCAMRLETLLSRGEPHELSFDPRTVPILWADGSSAVLLHEAIGHPAELAESHRVSWPSWLTVLDDPFFDGIGRMSFDDRGTRAEKVSLTAGSRLSCSRRASFRDVPAPRMTNLLVGPGAEPFEVPRNRLEIFLIRQGHYEPLTDVIELSISVSDWVEGDTRIVLAPWTLSLARREIAAHLAAADNGIFVYPGVLCSSQGQRLPVGSAGPRLLTRGLAGS